MQRSFLLLVAGLGLFALSLAGAPEYPKRGPDIYDTKADGNQQIAAALQRAEVGHKRVLLMFGANWCLWCHRLHTTFEQDAALRTVLAKNFEVVLVDVNTRNGTKRNAGVNERYGNPIKLGLPVLVVLDTAGQPLTTQETGALESGNGHDPKKVLAFLEQWGPGKR